MELIIEYSIPKAVLIDYEQMPQCVHIVNVEAKAYQADSPETYAILPHMFVLDKPASDSFVPFDNLTKEEVIQWLASNTKEWPSFLSAINDKYLAETLPTHVVDNPW